MAPSALATPKIPTEIPQLSASAVSAGSSRWPFRPARLICPPYRGSIAGLAGPVLAGHEHALVISLVLGYCQNDDARTPPGRLGKQFAARHVVAQPRHQCQKERI